YLAERQRLTAEADSRIASLMSSTQQLEISGAAAKRELEKLQRSIASLHNSLAERDFRIDGYQRRIATMKSSLTWRATAPIRKLHRHIRSTNPSQLRLKVAAALRHPASPQNRKSYRSQHRPTALVAAHDRPVGDLRRKSYAAAVPFKYVDTDISADGRVAAILHIYYDDLADELREHLDTIPGSPDLFIDRKS